MTDSNSSESSISFYSALGLIRSRIKPLGFEQLKLEKCVGRILAENLFAGVDSPSTDISLMDGFAVRADETAGSTTGNPSSLLIVGASLAGNPFKQIVPKKTAVKIFSGAAIPEGLDAVIPVENCTQIKSSVKVTSPAKRGENIVNQGSEIKSTSLIMNKQQVLSPRYMGLAAAAGIAKIKVYKKPRVFVLAIGDELVSPGKIIKPGQTYASNILMINSWLSSFGIKCKTSIVGDSFDDIKTEIKSHLPEADAVITNGGAWKSERDLIISVLDELGWEKIFHHVRMRPGKGVSFGLLKEKPVFCLPGGPSSNQKAFLQLALPGITTLSGSINEPLVTISANLKESVRGKFHDWTEFKDAEFFRDGSDNYSVAPYRGKSTALAMANATGIICIPEGTTLLRAGDTIQVQLQTPFLDSKIYAD